MSIQLNDEERASLERRANAPMKPSRRQKALALLRLAEGRTPRDAAEHAGISKECVEDLAAEFAKGGLAAVGLVQSRGHWRVSFDQASAPRNTTYLVGLPSGICCSEPKRRRRTMLFMSTVRSSRKRLRYTTALS